MECDIMYGMEIIILSPSAKAERVEFNGIVYRRYPNSKRQSDRRYYRCGGSDIRKGFSYLHRDMWIFHNGPIPDGFHVHHKDENYDHNALDNFEILTADDHFRKHPTLLEELPMLRKQMDHARISAIEWPGSEAARKWHSEHGKRIYVKRPLVERVCNLCAKKYRTRNRHPSEQFCSNKCKAANRRATGVDNIEITCAECGHLFTKNKYSKTLTCSGRCAALGRERKKRNS
ncbi:MAG TPA: HNH endonuclease signature motif containing protein [Pyrinomonadaceae bacterium]|nr:HNH endonuclease signature motif containing protein [Pyrinomonadaceae bacterium]